MSSHLLVLAASTNSTSSSLLLFPKPTSTSSPSSASTSSSKDSPLQSHRSTPRSYLFARRWRSPRGREVSSSKSRTQETRTRRGTWWKRDGLRFLLLLVSSSEGTSRTRYVLALISSRRRRVESDTDFESTRRTHSSSLIPSLPSTNSPSSVDFSPYQRNGMPSSPPSLDSPSLKQSSQPSRPRISLRLLAPQAS